MIKKKYTKFGMNSFFFCFFFLNKMDRQNGQTLVDHVLVMAVVVIVIIKLI